MKIYEGLATSMRLDDARNHLSTIIANAYPKGGDAARIYILAFAHADPQGGDAARIYILAFARCHTKLTCSPQGCAAKRSQPWPAWCLPRPALWPARLPRPA